MAQGLLDRLTFKTESDSDSDPDSDSPQFSEPNSEPDSDFMLEPDPAPKRSGRQKRESSPPPKATPAAKREARETIEALVDLPIQLWKRRDAHCAGVAEEQKDDMVEAFTAFVCKRPAWLAALTDLGKSGDWLKIVQATYPLVLAVMAHHVTRTVPDAEGGEDDLSAFHAPRLAG